VAPTLNEMDALSSLQSAHALMQVFYRAPEGPLATKFSGVAFKGFMDPATIQRMNRESQSVLAALDVPLEVTDADPQPEIIPIPGTDTT
jgi:hypothetical protein